MFSPCLCVSVVKGLGWGLSLDHAHDVFFAHHQQLVAFDLDGLAGVLAEQHTVADFHVERNQLALVVFLAGADGDDLALVGLFSGGVGDDDSGSGLALFLHAFDNHTVVQRTDFHCKVSIAVR